MKTKQKILIQVLIALIAVICIKNNAIYAQNLSGNQIFKINSKTITQATNIDQLKNMFGEPKIVKDSPFGGKAYTFYDNEYNWVLQIETNEFGVIKGYGGASRDFVSNNYRYGQENDDRIVFLQGTRLHYMDFFEDTDKVLGFYGYTNLTEQERKNYWTNYMADQDKYLESMQESSIVISKVANKINDKTVNPFNQTASSQDVLDVVEQLNGVSQSVTEYSLNSEKSSFLSFTASQKIEYVECYPNPLYLAQLTVGYTKDEDTYPYFLYNTRIDKYEPSYQTAQGLVEGVFVDPTFLQKKQYVELTDKENNLVEQVKQAYNAYLEQGESLKNENLWVTEPVYDRLPLVAGKMNQKAIESATLFLNAIRSGQDLQPLTSNQRLCEGAQHKSVLVLYLNNSTSGSYSHYFPKPDFIDQDFYDKAMNGVGENLYMGSYISSISYALNDRSGDSIYCGHRYNLLEPDYIEWGVGQAGPGFVYQTQTCHKFIGSTATQNDLVAWPANGVTLINAIAGGIGNWTAQFFRYNYDTSNVDTITVNNLSAQKTYEFENELTDSRLVSWNADEVTYESGDVFEITLHNVKNLKTNLYEDYKYRSVFLNCPNKITDISNVSISTNIDAKTLTIGQTFKINAVLNNYQELDNRLIKFISSDENIVTVRQNGLIEAKSSGNATITISSEQDSAICKTIAITVTGSGENPPTPPKPDDPSAIKVGDLDRNGVVDANDASLALELFKSDSETDIDILIGDLDDNDLIDANDASLILEYFKTHQ